MWREMTFWSGWASEREHDQHEQRERDGLGAPHPSPAPRDAGDRPGPGNGEQRVPGDRLRQMVLRVMAELVRGDGEHLLVLEAPVEQRVPEKHLARGPDPGRVRISGRRIAVDVLHAHLDVLGALDLREPADVGGQPRVLDLLRAGRQERRDEDEERRQGDEGKAARDPPPVSDEPREPHHDEHREREEEELRAEREPAAEQELDVADLRDVVAAVPPVAGDEERHVHEPDEAEAEHREQHPRADRPRCGLAHEAHSLHGVDAEDDEQRPPSTRASSRGGTARSGRRRRARLAVK